MGSCIILVRFPKRLKVAACQPSTHALSKILNILIYKLQVQARKNMQGFGNVCIQYNPRSCWIIFPTWQTSSPANNCSVLNYGFYTNWLQISPRYLLTVQEHPEAYQVILNVPGYTYQDVISVLLQGNELVINGQMERSATTDCTSRKLALVRGWSSVFPHVPWLCSTSTRWARWAKTRGFTFTSQLRCSKLKFSSLAPKWYCFYNLCKFTSLWQHDIDVSTGVK